jgi:nicotinamidase-related amidase
MELADLVAPSQTAFLISEMQRGIIGDLAGPVVAELAAAVRDRDVPGRLRTLAEGARRHGVPVVHATLQYRRNHVGVRISSPLMAVSMRNPEHLLVGSPEADIIPELRPEPGDIIHDRKHGMSAFTGTDLDMILRSLDIRTLVLGGVSLNEAVFGTALEAVNLGYSVAILRDGTVGVPQHFVDDMYRYVFSLLGALPTVDDVLAAWDLAPRDAAPTGPRNGGDR